MMLNIIIFHKKLYTPLQKHGTYQGSTLKKITILKCEAFQKNENFVGGGDHNFFLAVSNILRSEVQVCLTLPKILWGELESGLTVPKLLWGEYCFCLAVPNYFSDEWQFCLTVPKIFWREPQFSSHCRKICEVNYSEHFDTWYLILTPPIF